MKIMRLGRPLTALEATVMGIIFKHGPCLAHTVLTHFHQSPTYAYRSGAGAIYPLLKRLEAAGLLVVEQRKYRLTGTGLESVRQWIMPPFDSEAIGTNLDVLRSRVYFLKLLDRDELLTFCEEALASLHQLLAACHRTLEEQRASGDVFGELAMTGAVYETEARIRWMTQISEHVQRPEEQINFAVSASHAPGIFEDP